MTKIKQPKKFFNSWLKLMTDTEDIEGRYVEVLPNGEWSMGYRHG